MDKFAVNPQRGAGIDEVHAFDPAIVDHGAGYPLVETGERGAGAVCVAVSNRKVNVSAAYFALGGSIEIGEYKPDRKGRRFADEAEFPSYAIINHLY